MPSSLAGQEHLFVRLTNARAGMSDDSKISPPVKCLLLLLFFVMVVVVVIVVAVIVDVVLLLSTLWSEGLKNENLGLGPE